jgi:hypothetical protein
MWWLIAVGVTNSSSAAALKLDRRAVASKARSDASGGRRCVPMMNCPHLQGENYTFEGDESAGYADRNS